jgi:tetratricopeptide (TPR) repeat protein
MKNEWRVLAGVCAVVIGLYAYMAPSGYVASPTLNPADGYYNLLVQGFRAGQLNLKKEAPAGLTQLGNPYDPNANAPYRTAKYGLTDLSYYKGKLYLYFGITPAVLLFWPFAALTGHYLYDGQAVVIFCALGFLASVGILCGLRRRYFPDVSIWVVAAGAVALGLATAVPTMLPRSKVNEVAISCGYMLTMVALWAIWRALHETESRKRSGWLMAASVAYGLAVGARPSSLVGGIILLAPVAQAWRERRPVWPLLLAATVPIALIGLGLMLYNARRFGSPLDFGQRYQLTLEPQLTQQLFHIRYLWFNFRVYFLEPVRWGAHFPFVHEAIAPPLPPGYARVEAPYGILFSVPLGWLALAVPLAWQDRPGQATSILRWFGMVVALLFGICALTDGLFVSAVGRYEVDFLPALLLLAVGGILGLERALADRPRWRCTIRWVWGSLLVFSVAFNLLATVERYGDVCDAAGVSMQALGKTPEAIALFQEALRIEPDNADAHNHLGASLMGQGRLPEAIGHFERALLLRPNYAEAHNGLAIALFGLGKVPEAIGHFEQAVLLRPDYAEAHYNLGLALMEQGRLPEAIGHFEQAVLLRPNYAEAQYNLGVALREQGKLPEAIGHFEQAVRLKPDDAEAQSDLGAALEKMGKIDDAIAHYEESLKLRPDFAAARSALARLQAGQTGR